MPERKPAVDSYLPLTYITLNRDLAKPPMKLRHGWVGKCHSLHGYDYRCPKAKAGAQNNNQDQREDDYLSGSSISRCYGGGSSCQAMDNLMNVSLTNWGRVTRIYVSKQDHYWFRWWLVAWSVPSHYLKQCRNIVNWTLRNNLHTFHSSKCIWKCHLQIGCHLAWAPMCWNNRK